MKLMRSFNIMKLILWGGFLNKLPKIYAKETSIFITPHGMHLFLVLH